MLDSFFRLVKVICHLNLLKIGKMKKEELEPQ